MRGGECELCGEEAGRLCLLLPEQRRTARERFGRSPAFVCYGCYSRLSEGGPGL